MQIKCIEFNFETKTLREIPHERVETALDLGLFVWIDITAEDGFAAVKVLREHLHVPADMETRIVGGWPDAHYERLPDSLHLTLVGCTVDEKSFHQSRVDVVFGPDLFVTLSRGPVRFMDAVRKSYASDFVRFAKTPSFMLYEVCDNVTRSYEHVERHFKRHIDEVHSRLTGDAGQEIFTEVSRLSSDLLAFRKVVAPTRSVLFELSTRRTVIISEQTQPFIGSMVGELDRVLHDISANRDILNDAVNLYMSMIGFRTNRVVTRLTLLSFVFLPLTFLVGIYGMNFEHMPELKWEFGYLFFWMLVAATLCVLIALLRRLSRH